MRKFLTKFSLLVLGLILSSSSFAGNNFTELDQRGNPSFIRFEDNAALRQTNVTGQEILKQVLPLNASDEYVVYRQGTDTKGFQHQKLQQYYQGIKVEFATYNIHYNNGKALMANGDFLPIDAGTSTTPILTENSALQNALKHVGANTYKWQIAEEEQFIKKETGDAKATFYPKGELVFVEDFYGGSGKAKLAYKFDIYASTPISRGDVYVDSQNGAILFVNAQIHHVDALGSAQTRYSGTRDITTDFNGTNYTTKETGNRKCETYNCKKGTNYGSATLFSDADNNWTAGEFANTAKDNAGLDAHWGAEKVWDYWQTIHGRNSYNGNGATIKSYVHYSNAYENAFWDGSRMTYGDGASSFDALTSLDVCGHEIGHGVCTNTANLTYQGESGAINEGLSDIWGAAVEFFAAPEKEIWQIGEDIDKRSGSNGLRSMSNPKSENQPDTYKGSKWANTGSFIDNGGVHTNSGVMNYWFYLVSQGGSGTNDKGFAYNVTGIGFNKAELITFRAEDVYMTASTKYANARTYTIQAAIDLYGAGSPEVCTVENAWYAVFVGAACGGTSSCGAPTNIAVSGITNNTASVSFTPGATNNSYAVEISTDGGNTYTPTATGTASPIAISGLTTCTPYSLRVVGYCTVGNTASSAITFTTTGCVITCGVPSGVTVSAIGTNTATINWAPQTTATNFMVSYRVKSTSTWKNKTLGVNASSTVLTGLTANKTYQVRVKAKCQGSSTFTAYSSIVEFNTIASLNGLTNTQNVEILHSVSLFPSPANSVLNLSYFGKGVTNADIQLFDVTGRTVKSIQTDLSEGNDIAIDVADLSNGTYIVKISGAGMTNITDKFIINR